MEPMKLPAAIEVMKILKPYAEEMSQSTTDIGVIRALMRGLRDKNEEENLGRLVALMEGISFDEVAVRYRERSPQRPFVDLVKCFRANPIPDLINGGFALGLIEKPWRAD